jgi:hypothetical protein
LFLAYRVANGGRLMPFLRRIFITLSFLCIASTVFAGGSLKTDINGLPLHWEGTVVFNPESGALKPGVYDHAASVQLVADAFNTWLSIPGVQLDAQEGPELPDGGDTNAGNYKQFIGTPISNCYDNDPNTVCYTPIIFDEDGKVLDSMFGECSRFSMLGFAGFQDNTDASGDPARTVLKKGQAIFSGACIAPALTQDGCSPCIRVIDDTEIRTIMIHEIGHLLGMDHSQINPQVYDDCNTHGCSSGDKEGLPTMFPVLTKGANMETLHDDDIAYFLRLYGDPNQQGTCSVSGTIFESDGTTELRGAEVVARNTDSNQELYDAYSFVSGAQAPRFTMTGKGEANCKGDCGQYLITGLKPGESYQLCVQKIKSQFTGASSLEPVDPTRQDFADECPQGLTVTCECNAASGCSNFENQDIVADQSGNFGSSNLSVGNSAANGGCSLVKGAQSLPVMQGILGLFGLMGLFGLRLRNRVKAQK